MRHHNKNKKFGRVTKKRGALLKGLACALVQREKITTTEAKARELRPFIEKLITRGKFDTLASRRLLQGRLGSATETKKIFEKLSPRYEKRNGGYTRIIKLNSRPGDASKMAVIEFV